MSKSVVDEIEAELKQISPWPWETDPVHRKDMHGIYSQTNFKIAVTGDDFSDKANPDVSSSNLNTEANASFKNQFFLAKSPERLAALCRYVRATEALIETWGPLDLAAMSPELQAARRELGLEEK